MERAVDRAGRGAGGGAERANTGRWRPVQLDDARCPLQLHKKLIRKYLLLNYATGRAQPTRARRRRRRAAALFAARLERALAARP